MTEFKIQRGMLIRALKDQLPAQKGLVYRVMDVNSNLTLDGIWVRIPLDHSAWQEAHLPWVDDRIVMDNVIPLPPPTLYGKVLNFFKRGDNK